MQKNVSIDEDKDGFFASYIIENEKKEKVVKFTRLGMQYENILANFICSKFINIYDNINNEPLTERSYNEILGNKTKVSFKNYDLYVHSVLLCSQYETIYVDNDILSLDSLYKSPKLISLNLNKAMLPNTDILIDIFFSNWQSIRFVKLLIDKLNKEKDDLVFMLKCERKELNRIKAESLFYKSTLDSLKNNKLIKESYLYNKKDLKLIASPFKYFLDSKNILFKVLCVLFYKSRLNHMNNKQKQDYIDMLISIEKVISSPLKRKLIYFFYIVFIK